MKVKERKINLQKEWEKTKSEISIREKEIVKIYISFLREVAKHFLTKNVRVFFHENKVVHYGEGGFGSMIIECEENKNEEFGSYYSEIHFYPKANEKNIRGHKEITLKNLNDINYHL